ncbi:MAG: TonB-dependent receptor [Bacteroidota bacterium]
MRFIFVLLFCLLTCTPAFAQPQKADSVYALPAIKITALRLPQATRDAPVHLTTIKREDVLSSNSQTLAHLLDRAGSPFIRSYGNGLASLSFRGTGASQSLILLDGVPLSDPQLGQIDLSLVPAQLINSAQIQHGQGAALYGSQSIGSVINLATPNADQPFFLQTTASTGPFGERDGSLSTGLSRGAWQGLLSFAHSTEQGDFPFLNPSLFPPANSRREGADRTTSSLFVKVARLQPKSATLITGWYNTAERGLPGAATTSPKDERQWDTGSRLMARHLVTLSKGVFALTGATQRGSLRYSNPQLALDQTGRTRAYTLDAELTLDQAYGSMSAGISGSQYTARHPNLLRSARENRLAGFLSSVHPVSRLTLFPGLRLDTFFPSNGEHLVSLSPSLGVNFQLLQTIPLTLKANAGSGFRAPTFNDRFWQPGGNPELAPERSRQIEGGIVYTINHHAVEILIEASGFYNRIKNQITWLPSAANSSIWQPENIGTTKILGTEFALGSHFKMNKRWSISSHNSYTLADARDISEADTPAFNQPLRYTPRHVAKTRLGLSHQRNKLQVQLDASLRHISRRYITTDGQQFLPGYTTADFHLRVSRALPKTRVTAGVFVENVTDQAFEVIKGYPVPPRAIRFQLSILFAGENQDTR